MVEELQRLVHFPDEQISAQATVVCSVADVEILAERIRDLRSLGRGPISDMVALLEGLGVLVLEMAGHSRSLDAFSTWIDNRPLVFLNYFFVII